MVLEMQFTSCQGKYWNKLMEDHPFISVLKNYLSSDIVLLCQSYNTFELCQSCHIYHHFGFCPKKILSKSRSHVLKYVFDSHVKNCGRDNIIMQDFVFYNDDDNELWKWIIDSMNDRFPTHRYKIKFHDWTNCHEFEDTRHQASEFEDYWSGCRQVGKFEMIIYQKNNQFIPPVIEFQFKNSGMCHVRFESFDM